MSSKKWIRFWLIIMASIIALTGLLNFIIDPYGSNNMFQLSFNQAKNGSTLRPLHYKLPIVARGDIDNLMIGTSTIGAMKTETVSNYFGGKTFNLSSPSSLTDEQYYLLQYAIYFNKIKNVIYGLDFMSLNGAKEKRESEFDEISDQIKTYQNIKESPLIYFSIDSLKQSYRMLSGKKTTVYLKDGRRDFQSTQEKIANGNFEFRYNSEYAFFNNEQYSPYQYSGEKMTYVEKIIELCKSNGINLIIYTSPKYSEHFYTVYSNLTDNFDRFKKELSIITDYVDFEGINSISIDKNNYYDYLHLRENLSDKIFTVVFSRVSPDTSDKFGALVTKDTIGIHLKNIEQQIKNYRPYIQLNQ